MTMCPAPMKRRSWGTRGTMPGLYCPDPSPQQPFAPCLGTMPGSFDPPPPMLADGAMQTDHGARGAPFLGLLTPIPSSKQRLAWHLPNCPTYWPWGMLGTSLGRGPQPPTTPCTSYSLQAHIHPHCRVHGVPGLRPREAAPLRCSSLRGQQVRAGHAAVAACVAVAQ